MTHRTVSFDGMCWPLPNEDVEYRLRHPPICLQHCDLMIAAQIMSAYRAMISKTRDQRQKIVSMIRAEMNRQQRWEGDSDDRS